MDQPGKVANPARGQLNRDFYLSLPCPAFSFSMIRLNLVLTYVIHPSFRGGGHLSIYIGVTQLRTDNFYCRESAGTGPVVLKVVPVTGAAFAGHHGPMNVRLYFPTFTIGMKWAC